MIGAIQWEFEGSTKIVSLQIGQYFYKLYLLLSSIALIVSKRADNIAKKIKIRPEIILIWLIFSMAMFELGMGMIGRTLTRFQLNLTAVLFPILALVFGIYSIVKRSKKPQILETEKRAPSDITKETVDIKVTSTGNVNYCANCGTQLSPENKFCVNCGTEIE